MALPTEHADLGANVTVAIAIDPTDLIPGDTVVKINDRDLEGCHCDVVVTVTRRVYPNYPRRVAYGPDVLRAGDYLQCVHALTSCGRHAACGVTIAAAGGQPVDGSTQATCAPCAAVLRALTAMPDGHDGAS